MHVYREGMEFPLSPHLHEFTNPEALQTSSFHVFNRGIIMYAQVDEIIGHW